MDCEVRVGLIATHGGTFSQIVARAIQNKHNSEDVQICWDNIAAFDSARTCLHEGACAPTAACMAFSPLQGPTVNHRKVRDFYVVYE